jgi:hypothetical protein
MKTIFFAVAATVLVLGDVAQAQPSAAQVPTTIVVAKPQPTQPVAYPALNENPTGLPSYLLRPDGLLINGLLPAQGWEG